MLNNKVFNNYDEKKVVKNINFDTTKNNHLDEFLYSIDKKKFIATADNYDEEDNYFDDNDFLDEMKKKPIMRKIYSYLKEKNVDMENILYIFYVINELDRNVRNHSGLDYEDEFKIYLKVNNCQLEICFCDNGVGFEKSLSMLQEDNIVFEAVKEGITAKSNHSEVANEDNKNSGYGLFASHELAKVSGKMIIVSDEKFYETKKDEFCLIDTNKSYSDIAKVIVYLEIDLETLKKDLLEIQENAKIMSSKSKINGVTNSELIYHFETMINEEE